MFLRSARATLIVGIAIPGSFLMGILVISMLGLTINVVVLFALILSVGMLVDGAIVVTEYADREMMEGEPRSKAYGLAAVRLGWCYAPAGVADVLNRLRGPFNVTAPAQAAGIAAIGDQGFVDRVVAHNEEWRPWLETSLKDQGYEIVPSVTNFMLVKFRDEDDANAAIVHLEKHGLLVRDMRAYGLGDHLRITVGTGEECRAVDEALGSFRTKESVG